MLNFCISISDLVDRCEKKRMKLDNSLATTQLQMLKRASCFG